MVKWRKFKKSCWKFKNFQSLLLKFAQIHLKNAVDNQTIKVICKSFVLIKSNKRRGTTQPTKNKPMWALGLGRYDTYSEISKFGLAYITIIVRATQVQLWLISSYGLYSTYKQYL